MVVLLLLQLLPLPLLQTLLRLWLLLHLLQPLLLLLLLLLFLLQMMMLLLFLLLHIREQHEGWHRPTAVAPCLPSLVNVLVSFPSRIIIIIPRGETWWSITLWGDLYFTASDNVAPQ